MPLKIFGRFSCILAFVLISIALIYPAALMAEDLVWDGTGPNPWTMAPNNDVWVYPLQSSSGNKVFIKADIPGLPATGGLSYVQGLMVNSESSFNTIVVEGPQRLTVQMVHGGFNQMGTWVANVNSGTLKANDNSVTIRNAELFYGYRHTAYGGRNYFFGEGTVIAERNTVVVDNAQAYFVIGGSNEKADKNGETTGLANYNLVDVKDSTIDYMIVGGYNAPRITAGSAIYNTVILRGAVSVGTSVYGGNSKNGVATVGFDQFTGNHLFVVLPKASGIDIGAKLGGFEKYSFVLDPMLSSGSIVLDVAKSAVLTDSLGRSSVVDSLEMVDGAIPQ
ncbi:MAG: hypothetical protein LBE31_04890, partial [Deltaproteobacteria bacterium]|nr:hypothetical protein [Deltaproteobacteria bacterium]